MTSTPLLKLHRTGTHRAAPLELTRERVWPLLRPLGITRIANITGLDCIGIPVVAVCRPNARSIAVSQGKGCSLLAAEVSGVMEAIESYHAEHITQPLLLASWNQLRFSHRLLDPALLPPSALRRFHGDLKIHWIQGVDLIQAEECWVPYELVHTDFTLPLPADSGCFPMTSNGLASGNHLYEAIAHGTSEVIERDADTLFSLLPKDQRDGRVVRLDSIDSVICRELLEKFRAAGVAVKVWDITSDMGVAAFRAVIADERLDPRRPLRPHVGMGCHPAREVALARALTEAAQSRLTVISSSRDDLRRERYDRADLDRLESLREHAMSGTAGTTFTSVPHFEADDFQADVTWQKERLAAHGIKHLVAVDLTKPALGVPVVRMIAAGLETSREVPGWTPSSRAQALMKGEPP
jgi:YcaO-like protein with predicted kinase domain